MYKARSRLIDQTSPAAHTSVTRFARMKMQFPNLVHQFVKASTHLLHATAIPWKKYALHLPTFGISVLSWLLLWQLIVTVPPQHVQHFLFPNSYLPFTGLFFAASFFCLSFFLLNSRRGFVLASCLTWLVFLRLNQVELDSYTLGYILIFFGILESVLSIFEWLAPHVWNYLHANIKQTTPSENRPKPEGTTRYTPRRPRLTRNS
jgi:hypothetical protein